MSAGFAIVDAHAHLGPWGGFPIAHGDDLVPTLDRCGIATICVSHDLALGADWREGNRRALAAAERHPGRIAAWCTVNPNVAVADLEREMAAMLAHPGCCGLKFHTDLSAHPFNGPGYQPALEFAQAHGLAILTHGWVGPQALEEIALRYPRARFLLAHAGAAWDGRLADPNLEAAARLPNVWVDICGSGAHYGALERLVAMLGDRKVLWGTDCPWFDPGGYLYRVLHSTLPDSSQRRLLGDNAREVLRLAALP